jgi:hypothetical protein
LVEDMPFLGLLTGKYKIMETDTYAIAFQPGLLYMSEKLGSENYAGTFNGMLITDLFLDEDIIVSLSALFNMPFVKNDVDENMYFLTLTASLNLRLSDNAKFIVELSKSMSVYDDGSNDDISSSTNLNYGIRFFGENLAAILSFIRPIQSSDSPSILGIPYVTFTAKF